MELRVGQDLYSMCGKCGDVYHVVVALQDGKVSKVQCKHCNAYHRYRAPPGEVNVNKAVEARTPASKAKRPGAKRAPTARRSRSAKSIVVAPRIEPDLSVPVRPYNIRETYVPGERIQHPRFGEGVVEETTAATKIDVFFPDGRRTLVQGR
jgi:hypothetical protein